MRIKTDKLDLELPQVKAWAKGAEYQKNDISFRTTSKGAVLTSHGKIIKLLSDD